MLTERKSLQHNDAGGGTRTRKGRSPGDFKSPVFTDFTTPAYFRSYWTFDLPCPPPAAHRPVTNVVTNG